MHRPSQMPQASHEYLYTHFIETPYSLQRHPTDTPQSPSPTQLTNHTHHHTDTHKIPTDTHTDTFTGTPKHTPKHLKVHPTPWQTAQHILHRSLCVTHPSSSLHVTPQNPPQNRYPLQSNPHTSTTPHIPSQCQVHKHAPVHKLRPHVHTQSQLYRSPAHIYTQSTK